MNLLIYIEDGTWRGELMVYSNGTFELRPITTHEPSKCCCNRVKNLIGNSILFGFLRERLWKAKI